MLADDAKSFFMSVEMGKSLQNDLDLATTDGRNSGN